MDQESALNLLVDFIVYMALEDISFFRFLDFGSDADACQKLLSGLDFEYLEEKGNPKLRDRYRNQVINNLCEGLKPLANALKAGATEQEKIK